jgi:hypothetical protein
VFLITPAPDFAVENPHQSDKTSYSADCKGCFDGARTRQHFHNYEAFNMNRLLVFAPSVMFTIVVLLQFTGCGGERKLQIQGKVEYEGKPLKAEGLDQALVQFHNDKTMFYGSFDNAGNYQLEAPPGKYKVAVLATKAPKKKDPQADFDYSSPVYVIDAQYANPMSSRLEVEVKDGAAPGHYDLKLKKLPTDGGTTPMPGTF